MNTQLNIDLTDFLWIKRLNIKATIAGKNITTPNKLKPTLGFENIKKAKIHVDKRIIKI